MSEPMPDPAEENTRGRLLHASLNVFARRDFEAVSVREIVERADANIAAVSYHFGGKQGLYLATAGFLVDRLLQDLGDMLEHSRHAAHTADRATAAQLLADLICGLTRNLLLSGTGDDAAGFILREQLQPTAAFDILFDRLMQPMQETYQLLLTRLGNDSILADERLTILTTHALMGQILAFRMARTTVLRRLGQSALSEQDVKQIADQIVALTLRALDVAPPGEHPDE